MSKAVEPEKLEDHEAMDAMWGGGRIWDVIKEAQG